VPVAGARHSPRPEGPTTAGSGSHQQSGDPRLHDSVRTAKQAGLGVAGLGIVVVDVVVNVAPVLDRVQFEGAEENRTGYETDSLVPFTAYLGIGLLPATAYAAERARRVSTAA